MSPGNGYSTITGISFSYIVFSTHQHPHDPRFILPNHREHIIRDKTGSLSIDRYKLTGFLLRSQQLYVLLHANISRDRSHV